MIWPGLEHRLQLDGLEFSTQTIRPPHLPQQKNGCIKLCLFSCLFSSDEVDIIPCIHCHEEQNKEREDPFIIVNHKLGVKSWCIKPLFLFAYKKLMSSRKKGEKDCNVSGTINYKINIVV